MITVHSRRIPNVGTYDTMFGKLSREKKVLHSSCNAEVAITSQKQPGKKFANYGQRPKTKDEAHNDFLTQNTFHSLSKKFLQRNDTQTA